VPGGRRRSWPLWASVAIVALTVAAIVATGSASPSVSRCSSAQLRAAAGRSGAAAGTISADFAFVNAGSHACYLDGYPRVQMLGASGRPISTTDERIPAGQNGVQRARRVTIAAGKRAYFVVFFAAATGYGNAFCPTAARLLLTPPGSSGGLILRGSAARIQPYGGPTIQQLHCGELRIGPVTAKPL
jgi:hypothetical protein